MRLVGPLPPGPPAACLLAVLAERGLEAELREGALWVWDPARLAEARRALEAANRRPAHPAWRRALRRALSRSEAGREESRRQLRARTWRLARREARLRRALEAAPTSRPLTLALIGLLGLAAWLGPHEAAALLPLAASACWLHELGTRVEALEGTRRFALLVLAVALATQAALVTAGHDPAGLTGIAFGLLGFATVRARHGTAPPKGLVPLMSAWLLLGAAGVVPSSTLLAECTGLAAGLCLGGLAAWVRGRPALRRFVPVLPR